MNTNIEITNTENAEQTTQYILDENKELVEISKELCKPVEFPIRYKLTSAFEVFVRADGTENYWISNYGRCVNNLNHKDKNTFYEHRTGKRHYSIYEIEKQIDKCPFKQLKNGKIKLDESKSKRVQMLSLDLTEDECNAILEELQSKDEKRKYFIKTTRYQTETSPELLVAKHFLAPNRPGTKVWHKDGDEENNWYKNLIRVTTAEYRDLQSGKIPYEDLEPKQEYIEYENKASAAAHKHYGSIRSRCGDTTDKDYIGACYDDTTMCQEWLDDPKAFIKWYFEHYYEVEGESMAVDKDLFGNGSNMYSPETCCILPQSLNSFIANCKRHYRGDDRENALPMGVNRTRDGYYGNITLSSTGKEIKLSEWDTPEEAFAEYKVIKQADIKLVAAQYKDKIPDYIYNKLLTIEVKPY